MPTIRIEGMTCQHCVAAVTKALESVDGITKVSVDLEAGTAKYDEARPIDRTEVRRVIEEAGYRLG